jgi:metal-responsive CopG/Arc/MetJ family transcriptional regulator
MATTKIAISLDVDEARRLDELVANKVYPSRSKVIQEALADKLARISRSRLAEQCALLDGDAEQKMANEFSQGEIELWQEI